MKKGKITVSITIVIACLVLTFVMFMQFKIVNQTDITSIENMRKSELKTELANWKSKYDEVEQQYNEISTKINEYKTNNKTDNQNGELLQSELEQVNMALGKTDVQGPGIIITLRDTDNEEIAKYNADDLISIVNSLKSAGVEAISINDERVINMTDMVTISSSFIKVNGQRILSPYIIKAIGDQSYLEGALLGNGGYVDLLKKDRRNVTIEKENKIKINKYNGDITYKYMD
jgi:uncharacterized protein YlxW (UPF0749 family)